MSGTLAKILDDALRSLGEAETGDIQAGLCANPMPAAEWQAQLKKLAPAAMTRHPRLLSALKETFDFIDWAHSVGRP